MDDDTEFGDIAQIIDGARYDFQLDSQTLCLRIPQIYQNARAAGSISPKYWSDGECGLVKLLRQWFPAKQ